MGDCWHLDGQPLESRLLLGSARFPSPAILANAIAAANANVVTVSLRRHDAKSPCWDVLRQARVRLLPNTAGCLSAKEAVTVAHMAREIFASHWVKLEVIGDDHTLQPHPFELVEAARILVNDGFFVLPYTTDDLVLGDRLLSVGCKVLMPWGAPIGSGRGLSNPSALLTMRRRFPDIPLLIDAGIGAPSHAAQAMEMGFDGILLNTAVALAHDPVRMAAAFADAVRAGRAAFMAGLMLPREGAEPSTPVVGTPFWHGELRC